MGCVARKLRYPPMTVQCSHLVDASQSFATGRAPSIHLSNTDTKFPDEENDSGISGCKCYGQIGPPGA